MGDLVRAPGSELWAFLESLDANGVSPGDLDYARASNGEFGRLIAEFMKTRGEGYQVQVGVVIPKQVFTVTIDRDQPLSVMIKSGKYGYADSDIIAERFPIVGSGKVRAELELVHYDRKMESDHVIADMARRELQSGKIEHLLAFGAEFPELQRQFPIIELGSVWSLRGAHRHVAYLDGDVRERGLRLHRFEDWWGGRCRFLAVRKEESLES